MHPTQGQSGSMYYPCTTEISGTVYKTKWVRCMKATCWFVSVERRLFFGINFAKFWYMSNRGTCFHIACFWKLLEYSRCIPLPWYGAGKYGTTMYNPINEKAKRNNVDFLKQITNIHMYIIYTYIYRYTYYILYILYIYIFKYKHVYVMHVYIYIYFKSNNKNSNLYILYLIYTYYI